MTKTVHRVRVANVLHHGGAFWEPFDSWHRSLAAAERESLDRIGRRSPGEPVLVFNTGLAESVLAKQELPIYRRGRGQSESDRMRHLMDNGDLGGVNMPMRPAEDDDLYAHGLRPIEHKHRRWLAAMAKNGHVEPYRESTIEARGTGGVFVSGCVSKATGSPLLALLKPEFLDEDSKDDGVLHFNRDWFYIHAVLALTDSEWFAWELLQHGHTPAEIKRFWKPLSPSERLPLARQAEESGISLGNQTIDTTLRGLQRKLADAREHFSGSRELRPKAPRYRGEFMLGLSAYRATSPARTAAFSVRGYTVRQHLARTEIAAANAIRPQADGLTPAERFALGLSTYLATASRKPRGLYEPVIVFAASWTEPHDFRLVFQSIIDLDELFPPEDQHPGLLLRMLSEPESMPGVLLNAA